MKYKKICFNAQNIITETEKAILIKMPNKSVYAGYAFWHPKKLIQVEGGKGYFMSFSYSEDFTFLLKRQGKGNHKKMKVIDEITVSAFSMENAFH